jgi:hypothetical protein
MCGKAAPRGRKLCDSCRAQLAAPQETVMPPAAKTTARVAATPKEAPAPSLEGTLDPEVILSRSSLPPELVVKGLSDTPNAQKVIITPDPPAAAPTRRGCAPLLLALCGLPVLLLLWLPWAR